MFDFNFIHDMIDGVSGLNRVSEAKKGYESVGIIPLCLTRLKIY